MENFVYEREYPQEYEDPISPEERDLFLAMTRFYAASRHHYAFAVHSLAPRLFQSLMEACDEIAKKNYGRIKAVIDYSIFHASIDLWFNGYVEFQRTNLMSLLQRIADYAEMVRLTPLPNGELHICVEVSYFYTFPMEEVNET